MRSARSALVLSLVVVASRGVSAQTTPPVPPPPLDGYNVLVKDSLLERLAGNWQVTRTMGQKQTTGGVRVDWVLNHQFLRIQYLRDSAVANSYEATVYIGYDHTSERYVAHWLDLGGARWSETLGYGTAAPNGVRFVFEYPDGPFTNTFTYDRAANEWHMLLRQKSPRGEWTTFAEERFQHR